MTKPIKHEWPKFQSPPWVPETENLYQAIVARLKADGHIRPTLPEREAVHAIDCKFRKSHGLFCCTCDQSQ